MDQFDSPDYDARPDSVAHSDTDTDSVSDAVASPAVGQPRLGVAHLLMWTLGSALMFSVHPLTGATSGQPITAGRGVVYLFYGLVYGAALAGLALPLVRRWRGGVPFPVQPGHWLLVTNGLIALLLCASIVLLQTPADMGRQLASLGWQMTLHAAATGPPAVIYLWGAIAVRGGRRWAVVLAVLGLLHLFQAACLGLLATMAGGRATGLEILLFDVYRIVQSYGTLAAGFLVIGATLADVYRREDRDWLHLVGVFVEVATIVWITFGIFSQLPVLL